MFNFLRELLFKSKSWSNLVLEGTTRRFVLLLLPFEVIFFLNWELDGEISSSDSGTIPLNLQDLASLEHFANRNSEK